MLVQIILHQNNKTVLSLVSDALHNFNVNNKKDWISETFKTESFYLDNFYNKSKDDHLKINRHIIKKNKYYELCLLNWKHF